MDTEQPTTWPSSCAQLSLAFDTLHDLPSAELYLHDTGFALQGSTVAAAAAAAGACSGWRP